MAELVCPRCGRGNDKVHFIDAFCVDCYPLNVSAPADVSIEKCKRCGMMHFRGEWGPYSPKKIASHVESKCRGDFARAEYNIDAQAVTFTIVKDDEKLTVRRTVPFNITETVCPKCCRISGGYYEAIIQLRGGSRAKQETYAAMLVRKLEKVTFITKTEEKDEGLDLYVGHSKPVVRLMADLGVRSTISKKLVGRDQGKRLYRTTFLIRF